jgi:hypothetical protein
MMANGDVGPTNLKEVAGQVLAMTVVYVAVQAALSRWLPPGAGAYGVPSGLAPLSVWLACSAWGASILRNIAPSRWRPFTGVLAFLLFLVVLLIVAVSIDCFANPQGCEV